MKKHGTKVKRWYVAADLEAYTPAKSERVWTISRHRDLPGWNTGHSYPGFGLTYYAAKELADAANAAWWAKQRSR